MQITRSNILAISVFSGIAAGLLYLFFYTPHYTGLIQTPDTPYVFAHRGLGDFAPDNSLSWAKKAVQDGFYGVDVDAQFTKDKQVVIFHDLSVDRLTHASGKVASKTLVELTGLDLGEKYTSSTWETWTGSYVASFEDFVKVIARKDILMVELKVPTMKDTGMEREVARIIQKHQAHERVYLSSFNPVVLYRLKQIDPNLRTVMISMDTNWNAELLAEIRPEDRVDLPWILRQEWARVAARKMIDIDALSINHETNENTIDKLIKKGYPIFLWTIDDPKRVQWAIEKKPHSIITDNPYVVQDIIKSK